MPFAKSLACSCADKQSHVKLEVTLSSSCHTKSRVGGLRGRRWDNGVVTCKRVEITLRSIVEGNAANQRHVTGPSAMRIASRSWILDSLRRVGLQTLGLVYSALRCPMPQSIPDKCRRALLLRALSNPTE